MRNRASVLLLVIGVVSGYAVRSTTAPLTAQTPPERVPVDVGDTVTLVYQQLEPQSLAPTETCVVQEVRGLFVRCEPAKNSRVAQEWRNMAFVVGIAKRAK